MALFLSEEDVRRLLTVDVALEAAQRGAFGELYGAVHGLEGLLRGDLLPLGRVSRRQWARIANTPAAALGSARRKTCRATPRPGSSDAKASATSSSPPAS